MRRSTIRTPPPAALAWFAGITLAIGPGCSFDSHAGVVGVFVPVHAAHPVQPVEQAPAARPQDVPNEAVQHAGQKATAEAAPTTSVTTVSPSALPPPSAPPRNWIAIGGDLEQSFARTDAPMEEATLGSMRMRWDRASSGPVTGTPVVYDGIAYVSDWNVGVHAVRADGTDLWAAEVPSGVASTPFVTHDSVYVMSRDPFVLALDRATGAQRWRTRISDKALARLWGSPAVADGVVVVGLGAVRLARQSNAFSASDLSDFRGAVLGLDAVTGEVRWRFETTVGNDGKRYGAGVACRSTAAIDTVRKIAYIGTSNSLRSPASPYSDALLALDYTTTDPKGRLLWWTQFTQDDVGTANNPEGPDADVAATPNLFSYAGRDFVAVGDKAGVFYVIDRASGARVWPQPISSGSSAGGVIAGAAYADGTFYITSNHEGATRLIALSFPERRELWWTDLPSGLSFSSPLLLKDMVLLTPGATSSEDETSRLAAYRRSDGVDTGWSVPLPSRQAGGISLFGDAIFITYGFVLDNDRSEPDVTGGLMVLASD